MFEERFKMSIGAYVLLIKDAKVLLLQRKNTGWGDGNYSLIAGHIDGGETIASAAAREAKEEAGVIIDPKDLEIVHVLHRKGNNEYIEYFLMAKKWEGEPHNAEPERCDDVQWFPLHELPHNTVAHVFHVLEKYQKHLPFSEFGWE